MSPPSVALAPCIWSFEAERDTTKDTKSTKTEFTDQAGNSPGSKRFPIGQYIIGQ